MDATTQAIALFTVGTALRWWMLRRLIAPRLRA